MKKCAECGETRSISQYNPDCNSPKVCFRCRVSTVNIGFGGYREQFHTGTIAEYQREAVREAREAGHDPVPAWVTPDVSPGKTQIKKLQNHHKKLAEKGQADGVKL